MVEFDVSLEDHCPCGSKRRLRSCCFKDGTLRKAAANVVPQPPKTDRSVVGCYAAPLLDCDGKLSKEHYVSKAVLEQLEHIPSADFDGSWTIKHPLIPQANLGRIRPSTLAMRILCERHNGCLSPIDTQVSRLFSALDEIALEFRRYPTEQRNRVYLFNGHDLERWLLKVCVALTTFGDRVPTDTPMTFDLPISWLETLFGLRDFAPEQGLYIPRTIGKEFDEVRAVGVDYIARGGRLVGTIVNLRGTLLHLVMEPLVGSRHFMGEDHTYRPLELHETDGVSEKSICFTWDGPSDKGTIRRSNMAAD